MPIQPESEAGVQLRTRYDGYPIFVGALAVSRNATLLTTERSFMKAMVAAKEQPELVPPRFWTAVDHLKVLQGHLLDYSEEAELVFRMLEMNDDGVFWLGANRANEYHMSDAAAKAYISRMQFTQEELDWLWSFAQSMHCLAERPVERRCAR